MILNECAKVLRSKNAGPFYIALDIFFTNHAVFDWAQQSNVLSTESVAKAYGIDADKIRGPYWVESALGCKLTIPKNPSSSDPRCSDMMGAQQHIPLATISVPEEVRALLATETEQVQEKV